MDTFDHKFIENNNFYCKCFRLGCSLTPKLSFLPTDLPNDELYVSDNCWLKHIKASEVQNNKPTIIWVQIHGYGAFYLRKMVTKAVFTYKMNLNIHYTGDYLKAMELLLNDHMKTNDKKYEENPITFLNDLFKNSFLYCHFLENFNYEKIIILPFFSYYLDDFKKRIKQTYNASTT